MSTATNPLAGDPYPQQPPVAQPPQGGDAEAPDMAGALSGDFAIPTGPPFAQKVAAGADDAAAAMPPAAARQPGAWARALVAGVQDALAGFGAGGRTPPGAGGLYGLGAGAREAQARQAAQKQQQVENDQKQQQLMTEKQRSDVLNAYTQAQTITDARTSARLDQDALDKRTAAGRVAADALRANHAVIGEGVTEDDARPEFKAGGRFDPRNVIGYQTGETEVTKNGKTVTVPTWTILAREGKDATVTPELAALLKENGQALPAGTQMKADVLDALSTQAIAAQTTKNLIRKTLDDADLEHMKVENTVQANKDWATVNAYLGVHPADPILALSQLSQQKDPRTGKATDAAQAASRRLAVWDSKELETYRHDRVEEQQKAAADAQKKADFKGDEDAVDPQQFLNSLQPNERGIVQMIGEGRAPLNNPGYLLARKPEVLEAVAKAYPGFDASKVKGYQDAYKDYTSGKTSVALNSAATALQHLQELRDLNTKSSWVPGTKDYQRYQNKVDTVASELARFYGNDTVPGIASYRKTLDPTVGSRDAAIVTQAHSMGDKLDNFEQTWQNAAPSREYQAPMPGISNAAKQARASMDPEYARRLGPAASVPPGSVAVQIPGQPIGHIPQQNLAAFKAAHPDAQVIQ